MGRAELGGIVRQVCRLVGTPDRPEWSDEQLLQRFLIDRDESAFRLLVERHGRMVLGVCRNVLRQHQDAEDAFQATFLILARNAAAIRKGTALASFLHGVAYRTSLKARRQRDKRRWHERRAAPRITAGSSPDMDGALRELQEILTEEVNRLPDKYRGPFVLCCLEGKSRQEAAAQLGWKEGTVSGRLAEARQRLRQRLARRGIALSAALCAADLSRTAAAASVSPRLMNATIRGALSFGAGDAVTAAEVARLAKGVIHDMAPTTLKITTAALLAISLAVGAGLLACQALSGKPVEGQSPPSPPGPEKTDREVRKEPTPVERFRQMGEAVALEFSPDGTTLAAYTYGSPCHLKLWSAITGESLGQVEVSGQGVNSRPFAFSPDGKVVAVVDLSGPRVHCCDPATGKVVRTLPLPEPGGVGPVLLRYSPDGKRTAVAVTADKVLLLDSIMGKCLQEVGGHGFTIFSMDFSPDGKTLALGTWGPSLQWWDVATGKRLLGIEQKPDDRIPASLAYSRDGTWVAAGRGNRVTLCDAATGRERQRLEAPMRLVTGLACLPDGNRVVSAGRDGKVRVWDLRTGTVRWELDGAAEGRSLAVSADGRAVALGTVDHAIVWDLPFTGDDTLPEEKAVAAAHLERSWSDLAKDAPEAHQALRTLRSAPGMAVTILRSRLRPAAMPDADTTRRVRGLLRQLDGDSFADRESATRALEELGPGAEPLLRGALAGRPSPEARRRLEQVLKVLEQKSLRDWRAVKLLEHIGTPPAREWLDQLAHGADTRLTREATAAAGRLANRGRGTR
jgi:RNA polymerase sigma factor (sigma-70 family)